MSAQSETTQLPSVGTATTGVVCATVVVVAPAAAYAPIGPVAAVPWYASSTTLTLMVLVDVNVTDVPASVPPATFCQTRVTMLAATLELTSDQPVPEGARFAVALLAEALSTSPSPATTDAGTCTDHDVALRFLSLSPRNEIPGAVNATLTGWLATFPVSPVSSVTVSVIVYVPSNA